MRADRSNQRNWTPIVGAIAAMFLGAVLLLAAWTKIVDPDGFVEVITSEGLAFFNAPRVIAFVAIALEVGLGAALLLGLRRWWVLLPASMLVAFFLFLTGRTYWQFSQGLVDESASCGCFGNLVQRTPKEAFWQDTWLLGVPLLLSFVGLRSQRRDPNVIRQIGNTPNPPRLRVALVCIVTLLSLLVSWKAPSLPLDDMATRLRPGAETSNLCLGGKDAADRVCIDTIISELEKGDHLVVMTSLENEEFLAAVQQLNSYALNSTEKRLWVLTSDLPEIVNVFSWTHAPVFEVREAPAGLLRPLYRSLPRSFVVTDGEVTTTITGLPSLEVD